MSIWNKVLIGFIFVASLAFFYLALRTLKTHEHWREKARRFEKRIEAVDKENSLWLSGDPEKGEPESGEISEMCIERLQVELTKLLDKRGRVWYNCSPEVKPQTGKVAVTIDTAGSHGIADQTILLAFEERDVQDGGAFLGEFKVSGVDEDKIALEPAVRFTTQQIQRLDASQGTWMLYENWPIDGHEVFAKLDEDALRTMLPEGSVEEFRKDGQMMTTDEAQQLGLQGRVLAVDESGNVLYEDPVGNELRLVVDDQAGEARFLDKDGQPVADVDLSEKEVENGKGKYVRVLRDYQVLFKDYDKQQSVLLDLIESATRDKQYVVFARDDSQLQIQFREDQKASLKVKKTKYDRELNAVSNHLTTVQGQLAATRKAVEQMIRQNAATAAQIAKIFDAAKTRIDAHTRGVAQVESGAN